MVSSESFDMWKPGDYTAIQTKLQNYMESLTEGCSYVTVSNLRFWSGREISHPSDFLYFNIDCAVKRQVSFQRVFLLDKRFRDLDPQEVEMFKGHLDATRKSKGKIKTFVVESPDHPREELRKYGNFSVWLSNDSVPRLLLIMVYNDKTGEFERLEATKEQQRIDTYYHRFKVLLSRSEPIEDYLRKSGVVDSIRLEQGVHERPTHAGN